MSFLLADHLPGCAPLRPCKACVAVAFLEAKLSITDFAELINLVEGDGQEAREGSMGSLEEKATVEDLRLKLGAAFSLKEAKIFYVKDLVSKTKSDLLQLKVDLKEINHIEDRLAEHRANLRVAA